MPRFCFVVKYVVNSYMDLINELKEALAYFGIWEEMFYGIVGEYEKKHRFYHTWQYHIKPMSAEIVDLHLYGKITTEEKYILLATALYHDIVYEPLNPKNEEESADRFFKDASENHTDGKLATSKERLAVFNIIVGSKHHKPYDHLSTIFYDIDLAGLRTGDLSRMIEDGIRVMKEYQVFDYGLYKVGRDKIIATFKDKFPENANNIDAYLQWLKYYKPKVGLYAGSFNPFHIGHMDILKRAELTYDKVIVAIGDNPDKNMSTEEQLSNLKKVIPYHQVESFKGYLTDYVKKLEESGVEVTIVKGLRGGEDLNYETAQLRYMEDYTGTKVKMHYIVGDAKLSHISSSAIKKIASINPEHAKQYLP